MIKKVFIISLFFVFSFSKAQTDKLEILDNLYITAMNSRFDLMLSSGYKYIEPNSETDRIKDKFKESVYKFPSEKEIFKIAYKNNKQLRIYRLSHKIISKDTIDINCGEVLITVKKGVFFNNDLHFKKINSTISCGGTNGYQPDFRYVFSLKENKWINISDKYKLKE
ncbi:hypothetical protein [Flavobacterium pectinovorum]|uniref:Uncharacterized protein n=1 Tax=Flavobacterium pectinovorum TaxID=29533 RepID=A0A502F7V2_9FLAO|nr:hypothetical protein [Flavobacterium pectinovorum]TPG45400.1 hypothetical protein EAH81_02015 [Flavobacterium pectinovorum]